MVSGVEGREDFQPESVILSEEVVGVPLEGRSGLE